MTLNVETESEIELDPVCGAVVDLDAAGEHTLLVAFDGRSYAFCGPACRDRFTAAPLRYGAAGRSQP